MVYLDNAATTKIDHRVRLAMEPYENELYGNPGSRHQLGRKSLEAVVKARQRVANALHCKPEQIIFTSGGSEANNMVLKCIPFEYESEVMVSAIEHDSVLRGSDHLFPWIVYPNEEGRITLKEVKDAYVDMCKEDGIECGSKYPPLLSVMYANNETGVINDVKEIGKWCNEHSVLFHVDCVQGFTHKINVEEIGCDFLSISAHKIHGPKGIGCLFAKNPYETLKFPLISGGGAQEFGYRGGTENVPAIVGFGQACVLLPNNDEIDMKNISRLVKFRNDIIEGLAMHGMSGIVKTNGDVTQGNGKIINLAFEGIDAETLLIMLDNEGVYASAGSACTSNEVTPSHVLLAMGISEKRARESIRFSISKFTTDDELSAAANIVVDCILALKYNLNGGENNG